MYHSAAAIFGLSALSSFVVAQNGIAFTSFPSECSVGETCVFEYSAEGVRFLWLSISFRI